MKKILIMIVSAVLALTGCTKDTFVFVSTSDRPAVYQPGQTNANGEYVITFGGYTPTKAVASSHTGALGYDDFSIYGWNATETVMNPYHIQWSGSVNNWVYDGVDTQDLLYFSKTAPSYSFIGVVPEVGSGVYTTTFANGEVTVTDVEAFATQDSDAGTVDTPKEFLHSTATVNSADYAQAVALNFVHGNAKVLIKFKSDEADTKILDLKPSSTSNSAILTTGWTSSGTGAAPTGDYQSVSLHGTNTASKDWVTANKDAVNAEFTLYNADGTVFDPTAVVNGYRGFNVGTGYIKWSGVDKFTELGGYTVVRNYDNKLLSTYLPTNGYVIVAVQDDYVLFVKETLLDPSNEVALPNSGTDVEGILVLPATSVAGDGSDAVLATVTTKADAVVTTTGTTYISKATATSLAYAKPAGVFGASVASPTTWYTLPVGTENTGLTIKFSYQYKGTKFYDGRVYIPASYCQWEEGKIYSYTINISGYGNGSLNPGDVDVDDPTIPDSSDKQISFNATFGDYTSEVDVEVTFN